MPFEFELLTALLIPVLVLGVLRINAVMVFLSLCLGEILVTYVAKDPASFIAFISPHKDTLSTATMELGILLAPVVLTSVMMLWSVKGRWKVMANILPSVGVAVLLSLLAVPLFTPGLRGTIEAEPLWQQLERLQPLIVGVTAIISMVFLWMQRKGAKREE